MSEKVKSFEKNENHETAHTEPETLPVYAEKNDKIQDESINLKKVRETIGDLQEESKIDKSAFAEPAPDDGDLPPPNKELRADMLNKSLNSIRQHLNLADRTLSKYIHSGIVNSVSEATAKTLARPYAILAGGLVTLIGSSFYLYYARRLGYSYKYFVPILLFGGGFVVGIVAEILFKVISRHKKS